MTDEFFVEPEMFLFVETILYAPSNDFPGDIRTQLGINTYSEDLSKSSEGPVEPAEDFLNSSDGKSKPLPAPQPYLSENDESQFENKMQFHPLIEEPTNFKDNNTSSETQSIEDISGSLKNFLVLGSGWIRNFFIYLYQKSIISQEIFKIFQSIVCPSQKDTLIIKRKKRSKRQKQYKKIYINLKTLSILFNSEVLKPYLSEFLNSYFLRYLVTSKTKNKACLLRFLPVLKKGLFEGRITNLR